MRRFVVVLQFHFPVINDDSYWLGGAGPTNESQTYVRWPDVASCSQLKCNLDKFETLNHEIS